MSRIRNKKSILALLLVMIFATLPALAQNGEITDDQVNTIAKKLFCPVCENIPLDTCGTAACQDWREEIRLQLEQGLSEEQIISDFVTRFGDRVVGVPQDPALNAMSTITPWIIIAMGLAIAIFTFMRWQRSNRMIEKQKGTPADDTSSGTAFRSQIEKDLQNL